MTCPETLKMPDVQFISLTLGYALSWLPKPFSIYASPLRLLQGVLQPQSLKRNLSAANSNLGKKSQQRIQFIPRFLIKISVPFWKSAKTLQYF
jgi:hypothetical protein